MIKPVKNLITCSRNCDILAKTRSRMTTAITFSPQNDIDSREHYLVLTKSRSRSRARLRI